MTRSTTHPTDTSRWSLVVHRVTSTSVEVWVGTLFSSMSMPSQARIRLIDSAGTTRRSLIRQAEWRRPFSKLGQRFFEVRKFDRLKPDSRYTVCFDRQVEQDGQVSWQLLQMGCFETLPLRVPSHRSRPFTVAVGSCFYDPGDGRRAADAYRQLYDRGPPAYQPHIKFLTGDQVYLDIGFDSLSPIHRELRERIANDYARHWQSLGDLLARGGTWMLPDDHEYWNDYPYYDTLIPTLWMMSSHPSTRRTWKQAAKDGVNNVQRSSTVETFCLDRDLSFCIADLRSYRGVHRKQPVMMHPKTFPLLLDWARNLKSPGVLVISQPLLVERSNGERNLLSFTEQYRQLLEALGHTGHDIVVLSGDVHFGRIATVPLGPKGGKLIELISSPLSNLTGLNGISTATPVFRPSTFPDSSVLPSGWGQCPVDYNRAFSVQTVPSSSSYPKARTKEHFLTVSFNRTQSGVLQLSAQCWHVREPDKNQLPTAGFRHPFVTTLQ